MVLQQQPSSLTPDTPGNLEVFILEAHFSPQLRPAAATNAETVQAILASSFEAPASLSTLFQTTLRFCESDAGKSNPRAEAFVMSQRPGWQHMHWLCLAHKIHGAATKTWQLQLPTVSAVIHTCKHLSTSGSFAKLKVAVADLVRERFQYRQDISSSRLIVSNFKEHIMQYMAPADGFPRRHAIMKLAKDFFNGDWLDAKRVTHHCTGPACCQSPERSLEKAVLLTQKLCSTLHPRMFSRANWLHWSKTLEWFGVGGGLHNIFHEAFSRAFTQQHIAWEQQAAHTTADAELDFPGQLDGAIGGVCAQQDPQQPIAQLDASDRYAAERQSNAHSLKVAMAFLPELFDATYLMRITLEPQRQLMHEVLHLTSRQWEAKQIFAEQQGVPREFRGLLFHEGRMFEKFFRKTWMLLTDPSTWAQLPETESFRSDLCRFLMRSASVVQQLVVTTTTTFPFKLLLLLKHDDHAEARALEILSSPACSRCNFTKHFLELHNTVEKLLSPAAQETLRAIGRLGHGSTYVVERLHSTNLRRSASRAVTHRSTLHHLALHHAARAGAPMFAPQIDKPKRKEKKVAPTENELDTGLPAATQKPTGGGGAWRAFCHLHLAGRKFDNTIMRELASGHNALDAEQREYYAAIGRASP